MVAIVEYGVGNLYSLQSSLKALGVPAVVTGDARELRKADKIILPGVGAFKDAIQKLTDTGLAAEIKSLAQSGKPLLGICLGMQLLFEKSMEFGVHEGLGLIPGTIQPLQKALEEAGKPYKVPHIGWNPLHIEDKACPLLKDMQEGEPVYYVHSFFLPKTEATVASSGYGVTVTGAVQCKNVYGTQFHPEKSGKTGLSILKAFAQL